MRTRFASLVVLGLAGVVASACARGEEDSTRDTAATVEQAGSAIAGRREALAQLDSARTSFAKKDVAATARLLRSAVAFTRSEVATAPEAARPALVGAADVLDTLALQMEQGTLTSIERLDRAFARLHQAEARYHLARAQEAWAAKHAARAGEELVMATDHLERTARETGIALADLDTDAITAARTLAASLERGEEVGAPEFDRVAGAFEDAVGRVGAKLQTLQRGS